MEKVNPADKKVQCGDYILSVNGRTVADKEELSEAVNDIMKQHDESHEDKSTVNIKFLRGGEKMSADITPVRMDDGKYYMGIWVKDDLAGIGTITYYTKDGRFGALGHGIGDGTQSGNLLYANSGDLYSMKLTKIKKGKAGAPGEIGGVVYFGKKSHIGTLDCNSNLGIYGQLDSNELSEYAAEDTYYPVAGKDEIHTGSAQMISEISGKLEKYNLEITNIDKKATDTNKGMELKVTDDRLIELSGGIVQGTSGSPIIQDGKIIEQSPMCLSMIRPEATASALMRCCNYCPFCEARSTVPSMVTKQMLPPITFDTGSAINTPSVPIPKE